MKANWFVALPVTAGDWHERVGAAPSGVRLFHPEDLHLTVAFLGAVQEEAALRGFAEAAAIDLAVCEVVLGPIVPMGNPRRPSALSARLIAGEREVAAAITGIRHAISDAAGAPRENRPALPHLTLARPRRTATFAERALAIRWGAAIDLGAPRVTLSSIALYTWSEERKERLFKVVRQLPLRPST